MIIYFILIVKQATLLLLNVIDHSFPLVFSKRSYRYSTYLNHVQNHF